jgi:hypothetical protein
MFGAIIAKVRSLLFRFLDLLLGKTGIFVVLLGLFLVITGAIFLAQPGRARNKLLGMGFGQVKFILLCVCMFLGTAVLSFAFSHPGLLLKLFAFLAIAALVRGYFILKKKVFTRAIDWVSRIPLHALKVFSVFQIVIGIGMLVFSRRIFW